MALETIRIETRMARAALLAGAMASIVIALFFAKWNFANAVSTRTDEKDVADIALMLGPDDPQTHFAVAVMDERTFEPGDRERSLAEYERAAVLSPNNYLAWLELGKARDRAGDDAGAEAAYSRAAILAPSYADVQWAFGNFLVRAGRDEEGFALISRAAASTPTLIPPAVAIAEAIFDGDQPRILASLGGTSAVDGALVRSAIRKRDFPAALDAWRRIPQAERRVNFVDDGRYLASELIGARQFISAAEVVRDISSAGFGPQVGTITNGGFETLDLSEKDPFEWNIGSGEGQQVGLNGDRKTGGFYSLYMIFKSVEADRFRQVSQTVAVEPGGRYSFTGNYQGEINGGLAWEVANAADGKAIVRTPALGSTPEWREFRVDVEVPTDSSGIIIRLVRDGCTSSVCPINGRIWFDDLKLTKQ